MKKDKEPTKTANVPISLHNWYTGRAGIVQAKDKVRRSANWLINKVLAEYREKIDFAEAEQTQ